jgi:hypothetical protein
MHICIQMIEDIYSTEHTRNAMHIKNKKPKCSFHVAIEFILLIVPHWLKRENKFTMIKLFLFDFFAMH